MPRLSEHPHAAAWGRDEVAALAPAGHRLSLLHLYDVVTMGEGAAPPLPL